MSSSSTMKAFEQMGGNELQPLEALRFFCSLSMNGDDWIACEKLFDALAAPKKVHVLRHHQSVRHDPSKGQGGDCFQTAIACVLGVDKSELPEMNGPEFDAEKQIATADAFLRTKGYRIIELTIVSSSIDAALQWAGEASPDTVYIMTGGTSRGTCHSVLCKGSSFLHDPLPDGNFLIGPEIETGTYSVIYIVPLVEYAI